MTVRACVRARAHVCMQVFQHLDVRGQVVCQSRREGTGEQQHHHLLLHRRRASTPPSPRRSARWGDFLALISANSVASPVASAP